MAMITVFFGVNKLLIFAIECNSGPPVIHTLNFIVEIKKTLALALFGNKRFMLDKMP